jgi:hypothetical protein
MVEACVADIHTFGRERRALEMAKYAPCPQPYMMTKRPSDIFLIDELQQFYAARQADVRFIVTIRDPRAVLTSKHAKINPQEYYVSGKRLRAMYEHWQWARALETVVTVRHEDLVAKPEKSSTLDRAPGLAAPISGISAGGAAELRHVSAQRVAPAGPGEHRPLAGAAVRRAIDTPADQ